VPPVLVNCCFADIVSLLTNSGQFFIDLFFDGYREIKKRDCLLKNVGFGIFELASKLSAVKKRKGQ
jgi:hypothetical protein